MVFLVAAAAALVVPRAQEARRLSRARETLADLQRFSAALQIYAHDEGDWPPASQVPGAVPEGMEATLAATGWTEPAPIGGRYVLLIDSRQRGQLLRAAIAIVSTAESRVSDDRDQLDDLRREARKAGLPPGRVRLGYRGEPLYVLEN